MARRRWLITRKLANYRVRFMKHCIKGEHNIKATYVRGKVTEQVACMHCKFHS